jgi:AcrR family transcriptional regulator
MSQVEIKQRKSPTRNNRDRILETALELFNRLGEENVGTAKIAQTLGISPGNLYYHYQNREEIIRALFPRIDAGLVEALTPEPDATGPEVLARHYLGGFRVMYDYRFFFCGLPQLLRNDEQLRAQYLRLETQSRDRIRAIIEASLGFGSPAIRPTRKELDQVTTTTWVVFLAWLDFVCLRKPSAEVEDEDVRTGLHHVFSVLYPWLDDDYRRGVARALDRLFKAEVRRNRVS